MKKKVVILSCVLWASAVAFGVSRMLDYETSPGDQASAPHRWPADSRIDLSVDRATLIMAAHPHCPCTRASMGELGELMASIKDRVTVYVLFVKPAGMHENWEKTDLWRAAEGIPGVIAVCDEGGIEARRFGCETSGQVVLYNAQGHRLFQGGITMGRGREGDNDGADTIYLMLTGGKVDRTTSPVFGCPVFDHAKQDGEDTLCGRE
ncbi:MAG: RedB protein [Acidobacteriota bacterium]